MKTVGPLERKPLNTWVYRPKRTVACVALSSAITVSKATSAMQRTVPGAVGSMRSNANDVQHAAQGTNFYSAGADDSPSSWSVTPDNFRKSMAVFAVRKAVKKTWLNDYDQFTIPEAVL